jgi:hypothetical protein
MVLPALFRKFTGILVTRDLFHFFFLFIYLFGQMLIYFSSKRTPATSAKPEVKPDVKKGEKDKPVEEKMTPQERLKMKMRMALNKTSMHCAQQAGLSLTPPPPFLLLFLCFATQLKKI